MCCCVFAKGGGREKKDVWDGGNSRDRILHRMKQNVFLYVREEKKRLGQICKDSSSTNHSIPVQSRVK